MRFINLDLFGGTYGDPHFLILDGMSYTFNGYGEYTYLGIDNQFDPSADLNLGNRLCVFMSQIRTSSSLNT